MTARISNPVRAASRCITRGSVAARAGRGVVGGAEIAREGRVVRADRANVRPRAAVCARALRVRLRRAERCRDQPGAGVLWPPRMTREVIRRVQEEGTCCVEEQSGKERPHGGSVCLPGDNRE